MISNFHNLTLQINPRHREEEPQNINSKQDIRKTTNWRRIFALDSVVVKLQTLLSSHVDFLTNAIRHHRETI